MLLQVVSSYEFGQFLRILLWIAFPIAILSVIVTTYVNYLHKRRQKLVLHPPQQGENAYRGLLWLKNKYERDMAQATEKYDLLKQEFSKLEKKYHELLVSEQHGTVDLLNEQLEQASQRTKDMLTSLDASSFLLMNMYNKLERSDDNLGSRRTENAATSDSVVTSDNTINIEETKIASWAESSFAEQFSQEAIG